MSRYAKSEEWLARALKAIPLGAQTYSKSLTQYPRGASPFFITHGKGSKVFDADGNEYIDFGNALAAVTLGHNDPDVTRAVKEQIEKGTIFSLSNPLEVLVAEKIIEMVPCAERVRFGKNGSDATAAAVRLARAFTGRDHVAFCGYHGWHDWSIGATTRNKGVPKAVQALSSTFKYNDLDSLRKIFQVHSGGVAAVVMEPMNVAQPAPSFLQDVLALAHKEGALLVFDETITGFRFANGGAQELFGVTPDLATFGKGLANGYPLSAVAGRADVMKEAEEIFFSMTFGGETLSLAASLATLEKLQKQPVLETMKKRGQAILSGAGALIKKHRLEDVLSLSGHPAWSFLAFRDAAGYGLWQIKTLFLQEVFQRGILTVGTHNMSYAHTDADVEKLLSVYDEVFGILRTALDSKGLEKALRCEPLKPLFTVR